MLISRGNGYDCEMRRESEGRKWTLGRPCDYSLLACSRLLHVLTPSTSPYSRQADTTIEAEVKPTLALVGMDLADSFLYMIYCLL